MFLPFLLETTMTEEQFKTLFDESTARSWKVLEEKAKEYSTSQDRLDNFKVAAQECGTNPIAELIGMARKHWTSLVQMSRYPECYSRSTWLEKTTDLRNYMYLLEALLIDMEVK